MTMDWKGLLRRLRPTDHIKRRCPIDGFPMHEEQGVFTCPKGHTLNPNKKSPIDDVTKASSGHHSGEEI